ncbi:hypothetical protein F1737_04880 [Methanoplanus sp. FWC-SCC4]|uniref:Uncharacterized protein n=1 Tax=Methanochimaera problematica TaxID=2609417 RepID=A0AA97FER4_9EURY|nr:hypothetical protein [Methanoplanus sp. FWC-SCC4]WOF16086.1 hypothetical protein F1737_04880 [Methanoplanus sp. FWC-SCC4]
MGYRWHNKIDVDEAIVVLMNSVDKEGNVAPWLIKTINQSIADSGPELGKYFYEEVENHVPVVLRFFEVES